MIIAFNLILGDVQANDTNQEYEQECDNYQQRSNQNLKGTFYGVKFYIRSSDICGFKSNNKVLFCLERV